MRLAIQLTDSQVAGLRHWHSVVASFDEVEHATGADLIGVLNLLAKAASTPAVRGIRECGEDHDLALWLDPQAIREAYADCDDDPTVGMSDAELADVGLSVLDGIHDEYRRLLNGELRAQD